MIDDGFCATTAENRNNKKLRLFASFVLFEDGVQNLSRSDCNLFPLMPFLRTEIFSGTLQKFNSFLSYFKECF